MPRIELLYFDGCPNSRRLLDRVRELLAERRLPVVVEPVRVDSDEEAKAKRFLGSPTLRIDGVDVDPDAGERTDYGLRCRLYRDETGLAGAPDDACIRGALRRAEERRGAPSGCG
jgi:hypothetical protein